MTCRKKRVAALCLAVLLLCGAAACDRTPAESGNTSAAESAVSTAPQESGDSAPTDGSDPAAPTVPDSPSQSRSDGSGMTKRTSGVSGTGSRPVSTTTKGGTKTVKFSDLKLNDLSALTELPDADSGKNGTLYLIDSENMQQRLPNMSLFYDALKFTVSLQGLENRSGVSMYMKDAKSGLWLTLMRAYSDGLLYGKKIVTLRTIDAVIDKLGDRIKAHGIVLWDPEQPFLSNIATNVCGVEGYLPVMASDDEDSLHQKLIEKYGKSIIKLDLRGRFTGKAGTKIWDTSLSSVGSAKCDAYLWAMEKYVRTGRTSRDYIAYMTDYWPLSSKGNGKFLDNSVYETYLPSQDYVVQNRIFTFDLSVFKNEPVNDDPGQKTGTDFATLTRLLQYQYDRNGGKFSRCIGFPPFPYKYKGNRPGVNDDVMLEWTSVEVMTAYNISLEADCPGPSSLYNASVFSKHKPQVKRTQAARRQKALSSLPKYEDNTYYLYIFMGDYDAASWTYYSALNIWKDPARGKLPLAWAFNPNLSDRLPLMWDYFYATATDNDYFIAGDSGAGYINPNLLLEGKRKHSTLPDGLAAWAEFCTKWYKQCDITVTGMILDGNNGYAGERVLGAYTAFSPDGIGVWNWPNKDSGLSAVGSTGVSGMGQNWHITGHATFNADKGADMLIDMIDSRRALRFYPVKCCLNTPTQVEKAVTLAQKKLDAQGKGRRIKVVDPYTFFAMIAREMK